MKLDGNTIKPYLEQLVQEYKFEPHLVLDIVKAWLKTAFRRDYLYWDKKTSIQVTIWKNWEIIVYRIYTVTDNVEEPAKEISLEEAKKYRKDVKEWENILIDITPENLEFSRIAIQAAAQTIKQNLKKLEREKFYEKFQHKQGELLKAKIVRVVEDNIALEINWTTVVLPQEWQIPNKVYNQWEEIRVLLRKISKESKWITLDITQTWNDYIEAILKKIVPELEDWTVQIEKIARIPGKKSKVAVATSDERIDPVGVFVGSHWDRISTILEILDWERVDFVEYFEDINNFIKELFKPAKIENVEINDWIAKITVKDWDKAIAIWKQAINVKLISQMVWLRIDIQ